MIKDIKYFIFAVRDKYLQEYLLKFGELRLKDCNLEQIKILFDWAVDMVHQEFENDTVENKEN
jgi:hypothetical protein